MIEKRIVFILGAGASCPYRFPSAKGLRAQILSNFKTQYERYLYDSGEGVAEARIGRGYPEPTAVDPFLKCFDLSSTESIDLFLSRHPRFAGVGKMAICLSILHAEQESTFREQVEKPEHDWYFYLYNRLTREATRREDYQQLSRNPITFVTFNYDRSLEHFLSTSLQYSFEGMDKQKAKEELEKTPIIHVYGRLALREFAQSGERQILPYGKDVTSASLDLSDMIENVYVVHEERGKPELEKARTAISEAERIFFLGFGYAKENLEALDIPGTLRAEHDIYGTAMGWTNKEIHDIRSRLAEGLKQKGNTWGARSQVHIRDCDCVHLLREFL